MRNVVATSRTVIPSPNNSAAGINSEGFKSLDDQRILSLNIVNRSLERNSLIPFNSVAQFFEMNSCNAAKAPYSIISSALQHCFATGARLGRLELMDESNSWPRNQLLLALPPRTLKQLLPDVERIHCRRGQILLEADGSLDHVYFPDGGVMSVLAVYADGSAIEMATIGREGCTGVQAIFGAQISSIRLFVQIPGTAAKMSRPAFARAMTSMPPFRSLMYAYLQAFLEQVMVSVACNGAHSLKQRLARWSL